MLADGSFEKFVDENNADGPGYGDDNHGKSKAKRRCADGLICGLVGRAVVSIHPTLDAYTLKLSDPTNPIPPNGVVVGRLRTHGWATDWRYKLEGNLFGIGTTTGYLVVEPGTVAGQGKWSLVVPSNKQDKQIVSTGVFKECAPYDIVPPHAKPTESAAAFKDTSICQKAPSLHPQLQAAFRKLAAATRDESAARTGGSASAQTAARQTRLQIEREIQELMADPSEEGFAWFACDFGCCVAAEI
jgi:hypothetical protein